MMARPNREIEAYDGVEPPGHSRGGPVVRTAVCGSASAAPRRRRLNPYTHVVMIHAISALSTALADSLAAIEFPHISPVIFQVGPIKVRWYGMAYLVGFALAYAVLVRLSRRGRLRISQTDVSDLIGWLVIGVMVGGRGGWWLFYHVAQGPEPWYEPVAVWHGGMSFHGGLIGVLSVVWIWCRQTKSPFWNVADCAALVVPIGLFFGRIANFINAELVGRPSNLPWAVRFPGDDFTRHPSQIYEALLEGPLLLVSLWLADRWLAKSDGKIAGLFVILYGIFRFCVEFTREPDRQLGYIAFGWLTMGQLLSVLFTLGGVVLWWLAPGPLEANSSGPVDRHASRATRQGRA